MDRRSFNRTVGVIGLGMASGLGPQNVAGSETVPEGRGSYTSGRR